MKPKPKPKLKDEDEVGIKRQGSEFSVPFVETRIDMENYEKFEEKLRHFKRNFAQTQMMYVDKLKRIDDDQMDSLFIYYSKVHPDLLLLKVDIDELPPDAQVGIAVIKRGHAIGGGSQTTVK